MNNKTVTKSVCLKTRPKTALFPEILFHSLSGGNNLLNLLRGDPTIEQKILFVSSFLCSESVLRLDLMRASS